MLWPQHRSFKFLGVQRSKCLKQLPWQHFWPIYFWENSIFHKNRSEISILLTHRNWYLHRNWYFGQDFEKCYSDNEVLDRCFVQYISMKKLCVLSFYSRSYALDTCKWYFWKNLAKNLSRKEVLSLKYSTQIEVMDDFFSSWWWAEQNIWPNQNFKDVGPTAAGLVELMSYGCWQTNFYLLSKHKYLH